MLSQVGHGKMQMNHVSLAHVPLGGTCCRRRVMENVNEQSFAPKVVPKSPIEEDIAANFEQKLRFDLHKWDGSSLEFRYKQERRQLTEI